MRKKIAILIMMTLACVCANAEDTQYWHWMSFTGDNYEVVAGLSNFFAPEVEIRRKGGNGSNDNRYTYRYDITFKIFTKDEEGDPVKGSCIEYKDDSNGRTYYKDSKTGTTVDKQSGYVTIGDNPGKVLVYAYASAKDAYKENIDPATYELSGSYTIYINEDPNKIIFERGTYNEYQAVNEQNFTEPDYTVMKTWTTTEEYTAMKDVTSDYILTYKMVSDDEGNVNNIKDVAVGAYSCSRDNTTGTYVRKASGEVTIGGTEGTAYVQVTATPRSTSGRTNVLTDIYKINIVNPTVELTFSPEFSKDDDGNYILPLTAYVIDETHENGSDKLYKCDGAASVLPTYKLTTTVGDRVKDYTSDYTVEISSNNTLLSPVTKSEYAGGRDLVSYAGFGHTSPVSSSDKDYQTLQKGISGTLTYTFLRNGTLEFTRTVKVTVTEKDITTTDKQKLKLQLDKSMFTQDYVTETEDGYPEMHVYRYGLCDDGCGANDKYSTPVPHLMSGDVSLPLAKGEDETDRFRLLYKIVDEKTYADDCQYLEGYSDEADKGTLIQAADEETGCEIDESHIMMSGKAGKLKVAVYAVMLKSNIEDGKSADIKEMYDNIGEIVGYDNTYYTYTEPVYFYVDIMERKPTVTLDPAPEYTVFVEGENPHLSSRFNLTLTTTSKNNNLAETIKYKDGNYTLQFFVPEEYKDDFEIANFPEAETKKMTHNGKSGTMYFYMTANTDWYVNFINGGEYEIPYRWVSLNHDKFCNSDWGTMKWIYSPTSKIATEQRLDWYLQLVNEHQRDIVQQTYTIVAPGFDNEDVTKYYDFTYSFAGIADQYDTTESTEGFYQLAISGDYTVYYFEHEDEKYEYNSDYVAYTSTSTSLTYLLSSKDSDPEDYYSYVSPFGVCYPTDSKNIAYYVHKATGTILLPDGHIYMGDITKETGDIVVVVQATLKEDYADSGYDIPATTSYVIRVKGDDNPAEYEVIATCKSDDACKEESGGKYVNGELANQGGRFHFTEAGNISAGTFFTGVPGIKFTIGDEMSVKINSAEEWNTEAVDGTSPCCNHETGAGTVTYCNSFVERDDEGMPVAGSFYKFEPTVNGYLSVGGRFYNNHHYVLICNDDGEIYGDTITVTGGTNSIGVEKDGVVTKTLYFEAADKTFEKPLLAGRTYYMYDASAEDGAECLRMHTFTYQPAFVLDRSTTQEESEAGIKAVIYANDMQVDVPTLRTGKNSYVTYEIGAADDTPETVTDYESYIKVDPVTGELEMKQMTIDDDGKPFNLRVTATVRSSDSKLQVDCVTKTTSYDVKALNIPTYMVDKTHTDATYSNGMAVSTTNIPTAITMTFGGWENGTYTANGEARTDKWEYKSKDGAASRIAGGSTQNDPAYNKTLDGFEYFCGAVQNPVDETNEMYKVESSDEFKSGRVYEKGDTKYNTTYSLPCRGAHLKFEPEESGTVILYLVQNGSVDYYEGTTDEKAYQVKWRPLYIVDQIGRPVTLTDNFDGHTFLPSNEPRAAYTEGISRCGKDVAAVTKMISKLRTPSAASVVDGCTFDWSGFLGSEDDRTKLLKAWKSKGEKMDVVTLDNGAHVLTHKAYVRYAFPVVAGNTYFVFQPGSKFEFGGFSFLPVGFPSTCKYQMAWGDDKKAVKNDDNQEHTFGGAYGKSVEGNTLQDSDGNDLSFTWDTKKTMFAEKDKTLDNLNIVINDRRESELSNGKDKNTLIKRSFDKGKYDGLCLPFSVSARQCKELFGDGYMLLTCDGIDTDGRLHFIRHANGYIEAGRPYLVKPTTGGYYHFHNVSIEDDVQVDDNKYYVTTPERFDVDVETAKDKWIFKGVYSKTKMPAYSYFIKEQGLHYYEKDMTIGGYRAFFEYQTATSSSSKAGAFEFAMDDLSSAGDGTLDDMATGVMLVDADGNMTRVKATSGVYNINGQKIGDSPTSVNTAPAGVYIIDGVKIVK